VGQDSVEIDAYLPGTAPLGVLPANRDAVKCASKVAKKANVLLRKILSCRSKSDKAAVKGTAFDQQVCEDTAIAKFDAAMARLRGCRPCLTDRTIMLRERVLSVARNLSDIGHCSTDPLDEATLQCVTGVIKAAAKLAKLAAKCNAKHVKALSEGASFDRATCRAAAHAKYAGNSVAATCPACLSSHFDGVADMIESYVDLTLNGMVYCGGGAPLG
jgi:hypothetical protein